MRRKEKDPGAVLDRIANEIRQETIDPALEQQAAARVWSLLSAKIPAAAAAAESLSPDGRIEGCSGFQELFASYLQGGLSQARCLLLEDHLQACVRCRKALRSRSATGEGEAVERSAGDWGVAGVETASRVEVRHGPRRGLAGAERAGDEAARWELFVPGRAARWGLAAAALVGVSLAGLAAIKSLSPTAPVELAHVESIEGGLFRLSEGGSPVATSERLRPGEAVRTGKGSGALVRLDDGSLVEMKERSEISVTGGRGATTVRLARGSVIVRAAKQHGGQLRVATADCLVSVEGTIFAVNSGTKGSRVSVLDGEVQVDRGRQRSVLHPGQQLSTSSSLAPVALDQEIAWSRDAADYLELLRRISALRAQLEEQIPAPPLRHSTRLLDLSPEGTVLYAAVPNLSEALSEGHRLLKRKIEQDELLEQWWRMSAGKDIEPELEEILEKLRAFGSHLGDEIVLTVQMDAQGRPEGPVVMAEVGRPEDLKLFLGDELRKASASAGPRLRLLPDPLPPASDAPAGAPSGNEILFWVHGDLFVATPSSRSLRRLAAGLDRPVPGGFASSLFCSRIAECYRDGVEYIVSADIERILHEALERGSNAAEVGSRVEALRRSGILDLQQVSLERKEEGGRSQDRLELSFDKPRRGLASWLAPPAPMGTLEFISPEAELAAVFVVKNPASLLEDLIGVAQAAHPDFPQLLSRFESERGVSIRHDFAAPLGGEFAFALDGPMLPVPSWKLALEVYDPARLQRSVEWLVDQANGRSEAPGAAANLSLEREESAGRTFYVLRSANPPLEAHYTYVEGYLLAAPSRALLERAIQQKASHLTLTSAPSFMELLPRDGQVNFSAIVYQNLGSALGSLPKSWPGGLQALTPPQKRSIEAFELASSPSLLYAYGEQNRIVLASSGHGSLGPDLAALLGLGAFGLPAGEATERER